MKNFQCLFLRQVTQDDIVFISHRIRRADRAELEASFPGQSVQGLLEQFVRQSQDCFTFVPRQQPAAVGGITSQGCIWLLTTKEVEKYPKTFFRTAQLYLANQLNRHHLLFNWVDQNYTGAVQLIVHLGGIFSGKYQNFSKRKFLFFTFRRNHSMGGIIQTGRQFTSTAVEALNQRKHTQRYFAQQARQTQAQREQARVDYQQQTGYLFRSLAEKNRTLYEQARTQAAALQNRLAHNGLDTSSATVALILEKNKLLADQAQSQLAAQTSAAIEEAEAKQSQTESSLREKQAQQHHQANRKSTVWKMTKKLFSWFK